MAAPADPSEPLLLVALDRIVVPGASEPCPLALFRAPAGRLLAVAGPGARSLEEDFWAALLERWADWGELPRCYERAPDGSLGEVAFSGPGPEQRTFEDALLEAHLARAGADQGAPSDRGGSSEGLRQGALRDERTAFPAGPGTSESRA